MSRVTIRDVAREAGVSISAVSYILNKSAAKKYSPETVRRVEEAARLLGYAPNSIARSMRAQRAHAIGVVTLWGMGERVFVKLLEGIVARAAQENYAVTICPYESYLDYFRNCRLDGIVFIAPFAAIASSFDEAADIRRIHEAGLPCVVINGSTRVEGTSYLNFDFRHATRLLTEDLLSRGFRRITYVTAPLEGNVEYEDRLLGYKEAMRQAGLPADVCQTDQLDKRIASFRAVVTNKSDTARLVLEKAIARGLSVPGDFPVLAGNTENYSEYLYPSLTTSQFPFGRIGERAVEVLLGQLHGQTEPVVECARCEILRHQSG